MGAQNLRRGGGLLHVVGDAKYGLFMMITFEPRLLEMAGITCGHQLAELVLAEAGIDAVSSDRFGMAHPCLRLNIHGPRKDDMKKDYNLSKDVIERLFTLADRINKGLVTYVGALSPAFGASV